MSALDNSSAFPFQASHSSEVGEPDYGMTLRDYFAGQFIAGAASTIDGLENIRFHLMAHDAYAAADAMLAERAKATAA